MKINFCKILLNPITFLIFLISLLSSEGNFLKAEYSFDELQLDSSTKTDEDKLSLPTNPFEIVDMIRRYNSLNDATKPSDALDDALDSFNSLEEIQEF